MQAQQRVWSQHDHATFKLIEFPKQNVAQRSPLSGKGESTVRTANCNGICTYAEIRFAQVVALQPLAFHNHFDRGKCLSSLVLTFCDSAVGIKAS
jgi:hypothetical protein